VKSSGCLVQHTHGVCATRWRNPRDRRKGSRVLAVTQDDPALTDLRLLLQINQAVTLGDLDRYEEAIAAGQVRARLASTNDRASANSSA
jgi:hypothetical protein